MDNMVLWNNEMDICIGLATELDRNQFIQEARKTHLKLTNETLMPGDFKVNQDPDKFVWRLIVNI
jgi:hypothetical protein